MTYTWNIPINKYDFNISLDRIYNTLTYPMYNKLRLVYAIRCYETGESYYGSSKDLRDRMRKHHKENNLCASKKIINRGNFIVEVVEWGFETKQSMLRAERYYINNYPCVNERVPLEITTKRTESRRRADARYYQKLKWRKFIVRLNELLLNNYKLNMLLHNNAVI